MSNDLPAADRISFLRGLRAVRRFRPDAVPGHVVADLLDVARWSGSASNRQPWELIVVRDGVTLAAVSAVEGWASHLAEAPLGIVLVMAGAADQAEQETYDEGRLAERIMLAAAAHGVGSSIGWFAGGGREEARRLLGAPVGCVVRTALSFGYPEATGGELRPRLGSARKPLAAIVHHERYG